MKIIRRSRHRFVAPAFLLMLAGALVLPATVGAASAPLFSDGFESGTLTNWTAHAGFQVQSAVVFQGSWAGRATVVSQPGYAWKDLSAPKTDLYFFSRLNLRSSSGNVTFLRLRNSTTHAALVSIGANAKSKLNRKDDVTGVTLTSTTVLTKAVWHTLEVHAIVNGTSSTIEVWLDGTKVTALSGTDNLGTVPIGRIQIGSDKSATMDAVFDDVAADTAFLTGSDTTPPTIPQNLRYTLLASNRVDLAWDPSTDNVGVTGYAVYRNGASTPLATVTTGTTFSDLTVATSTPYTYTVDAFDASTNRSAQSSPPLSVNTPAPDTTKPVKVTGLTASSPYTTRVDLSWNATTDDNAVIGYTVYRNGAALATVNGVTVQYHDLTVSSGTPYTYTVDAFDAANNHSDLSDPANVTASTQDPVIGAAGDIACDPADVDFLGGAGTHNDCAAKATSDRLLADNLTAVLPLGDEQYECGGATAFTQSYDLSWGRFKNISDPVPGNHEYDSQTDTPTGTGCSPLNDAAGYYQYFGTSFGAGTGDPSHGYYSFDIGTWHIIALNSECAKIGGCNAGSPEELWLKSDLAAHTNTCTLAYWHRPRFASSVAGNNNNFDQFWQDLYNANADVILNAHFHAYERFAPQNPSEVADSTRGLREFIVGTGGENWGTFAAIQPTSLVQKTGAFGVLEMTLHPTGYDWKFISVLGDTNFTDQSSGTCH